MKYFKFLVLAAIAVILTACPYSSKVPLSEPESKFPKDLLGEWKKSGSDNDYYVIDKMDKYRFSIQKNAFSTSDSTYTKTNYTGFITEIGDVQFLNIIEEEAENYYFYKLVFNTKNNFLLYPVTDNIDEKFEISSKMRAFFDKYKHLSFFYEDAEKYNRK